MRADAAEAASHYREAFERSQDPLVASSATSAARVAGVHDRVTGLFTNRDNGPTADEPVA